VQRITHSIQRGLAGFHYPLHVGNRSTSTTSTSDLGSEFDDLVRSIALYPEPLRPFETRYSAFATLVVLTYVNSDYIDVFKTWLQYVYRSGLNRGVLVVTHDKNVRTRLLNSTDIKSIPIRFNVFVLETTTALTLQDIWQSRWRVARAILMMGFDVVLSDVDAIWVKPIDSLRQIVHDNRLDVLSGRGRYPPDIASEWGSTCTFFKLKFTEYSVHGMDLFTTKCGDIGLASKIAR
jgi:hypothetical protein